MPKDRKWPRIPEPLLTGLSLTEAFLTGRGRALCSVKERYGCKRLGGPPSCRVQPRWLRFKAEGESQ
eukprot:366556-Chlamydomonas_euryale.AAC.15